MRRASGELHRQLPHADAVAPLELGFADAVLFGVVITTKRDDPFVVRLVRYAATGPDTDMRCLDRARVTSRDATGETADPRPVSWEAISLFGLGAVAMEARGQCHARTS